MHGNSTNTSNDQRKTGNPLLRAFRLVLDALLFVPRLIIKSYRKLFSHREEHKTETSVVACDRKEDNKQAVSNVREVESSISKILPATPDRSTVVQPLTDDTIDTNMYQPSKHNAQNTEVNKNKTKGGNMEPYKTNKQKEYKKPVAESVEKQHSQDVESKDNLEEKKATLEDISCRLSGQNENITILNGDERLKAISLLKKEIKQCSKHHSKDIDLRLEVPKLENIKKQYMSFFPESQEDNSQISELANVETQSLSDSGQKFEDSSKKLKNKKQELKVSEQALKKEQKQLKEQEDKELTTKRALDQIFKIQSEIDKLMGNLKGKKDTSSEEKRVLSPYKTVIAEKLRTIKYESIKKILAEFKKVYEAQDLRIQQINSFNEKISNIKQKIADHQQEIDPQEEGIINDIIKKIDDIQKIEQKSTAVDIIKKLQEELQNLQKLYTNLSVIKRTIFEESKSCKKKIAELKKQKALNKIVQIGTQGEVTKLELEQKSLNTKLKEIEDLVQGIQKKESQVKTILTCLQKYEQQEKKCLENLETYKNKIQKLVNKNTLYDLANSNNENNPNAEEEINTNESREDESVKTKTETDKLRDKEIMESIKKAIENSEKVLTTIKAIIDKPEKQSNPEPKNDQNPTSNIQKNASDSNTEDQKDASSTQTTPYTKIVTTLQTKLGNSKTNTTINLQNYDCIQYKKGSDKTETILEFTEQDKTDTDKPQKDELTTVSSFKKDDQQDIFSKIKEGVVGRLAKDTEELFEKANVFISNIATISKSDNNQNLAPVIEKNASDSNTVPQLVDPDIQKNSATSSTTEQSDDKTTVSKKAQQQNSDQKNKKRRKIRVAKIKDPTNNLEQNKSCSSQLANPQIGQCNSSVATVQKS